MTSTQPNSERYGERLYSQIIDGRARSGYSRTFALLPKSTNSSEGFESISYHVLPMLWTGFAGGSMPNFPVLKKEKILLHTLVPMIFDILLSSSLHERLVEKCVKKSACPTFLMQL
jgi:hypothetical protein